MEIHNLTVTVEGRHLVDDVSFTVPTGQWVNVIGPNGAGKTTLVETVAGVRNPTRGTVLIAGQNVHELRERPRALLLAFVPQHPVAPSGMSVFDYVALGRTAHHGLLQGITEKDRQMVHQILARVTLCTLVHRDLATLSGGERQRAVLARALVQAPRLVVLDEPTTGLDLRHQMEILELVRREVEEGRLSVLATLHDLTLAGQFADELVLLNNAKVTAKGSAREVVRSKELQEAYQMSLHVVEIDGADVVVPRRLGVAVHVQGNGSVIGLNETNGPHSIPR